MASKLMFIAITMVSVTMVMSAVVPDSKGALDKDEVMLLFMGSGEGSGKGII